MSKRFLITNDDGIDAAGLLALVEALRPLGETWTVAPDREQSATAHALTLHKPLRVRELGERRFTVSGTPTDCVFVALGQLMPQPPDLIVSGINRGGNVAADVTYSGTVAAALEGALRGIPSLAVSRVSHEDGDYGPAASIALDVIRQMLTHGLASETCLNLNVPPLPADQIRGVVLAPLGRRHYGGDIDQRSDPRTRPYSWVGGTQVTDEERPGADNILVRDGYAALTPLTIDWTDHAVLRDLADWDLT